MPTEVHVMYQAHSRTWTGGGTGEEVNNIDPVDPRLSLRARHGSTNPGIHLLDDFTPFVLHGRDPVVAESDTRSRNRYVPDIVPSVPDR